MRMRARSVLQFAVVVASGAVLAACAALPTPEDANDALSMLRQHRSWAWALGIVLLWADVVLPVPQTAVIAALGIVYGALLGGLVGSVGLIGGGLLGYLVVRTALQGFLKRLVGRRAMERAEGLFEHAGGWAIVLSRSLPYSIPEALVFLAGIAGMPMRQFLASLALGSIPIAFAFAAIGAGLADEPALALLGSSVLPVALLPLVLSLLRRPS
jgi:uncharacterized membrane protein YdjX (TVP38/TMEM64 family)